MVVQSSASFDELFGKYMQGLSLDKKCVAHHQGRQDLKGSWGVRAAGCVKRIFFAETLDIIRLTEEILAKTC